MIEYQIFGRLKENGEWCRPLVHSSCICKTKDEALLLIKIAKDQDLERTYMYPGKKTRFDAFKIMEREVSEWKDDEVIP